VRGWIRRAPALLSKFTLAQGASERNKYAWNVQDAKRTQRGAAGQF
jgi:hypothetical protein